MLVTVYCSNRPNDPEDVAYRVFYDEGNDMNNMDAVSNHCDKYGRQCVLDRSRLEC